MSNVNRYRYGDQELIEAPVDETMVIEIGDFVVRATAADATEDGDNVTEDNAIPASAMADSGSVDIAEAAGCAQFLGVAMSQSLSGKTDPILIATKGFFELTEKTKSAVAVGDPVEIYASGKNCEDQTVVAGTATSMIAVCVKAKTDALAGVLCKLVPSILLDDAAHA